MVKHLLHLLLIGKCRKDVIFDLSLLQGSPPSLFKTQIFLKKGVCVDGWPFLWHAYSLQPLKHFTRLNSKKIDLTHLMPKTDFWKTFSFPKSDFSLEKLKLLPQGSRYNQYLFCSKALSVSKLLSGQIFYIWFLLWGKSDLIPGGRLF
jgi:hypothetical protein